MPLVGQQALFNWCQHNWFEILFLTEMDSLGWARAVFILDGQEIKCNPMQGDILFAGEDGSFVDARLGGFVMDGLRRPVSYCGCNNLIDPDAHAEEEEEDEEEDEEDSTSSGEEQDMGVHVPVSRSEIRLAFSERAVVEARRSGIRHRAVVQGSPFALFLDQLDLMVISLACLFFCVYIIYAV